MTQVSWRRQLILAVVLFALGSAAYWLEFKRKPQQESAQEQTKKPFELKDIQVQTIKVSGGSKSIEINCSDLAAKLCKSGDNSKWEITEPMKLKADDSNVNSLLSSLNNLAATEIIDLKEETPEKRAALLKEYGLDAESLKSPATRRVLVKTVDGESTFYLGGTHPIGENIFAVRSKSGKVDDTSVYLVPNYFKSTFDHDLTYWRDKKLLTVASHEIASFKLDNTKAHITADRKDGQWLLHSKNEEFAGDIENIDSLLSATGYLNAKAFVSDDRKSAKAKSILQGVRPIITLTLQKEKGKEDQAPAPITLTLFEKVSKKSKKDSKPNTGKLYATVSNLDPLFEIEPSSKDRLDKDLKDLRLAKLITSMERFTAKRLEFTGSPIGATPLTLVNTDNKWLAQPEKTEVNTDKVQTFLDKLSGSRIKDFLQGSAIPKGEHEGLKFTLGDEKSDAKRQIVFWKNDNKLYARDLKSNRKEAFLLDNVIQSDIPWDRTYFKKAEEKPKGS